MSPSPPAVAVRGLVKRYGPTTAVDGLDLELAAGAGAGAARARTAPGKTTTVEVCDGLPAPPTPARSACSASTRPAPPTRCGPGSASMPQGGGAYPGVRAGGDAAAWSRRARRTRSTRLAARRAGPRPAAPAPRTSGSPAAQQQRLALACAVVGRPELVFLDEPTAGMDPQGRRLVWELVAALRRDGVAVLLTTHLMEEAEALADDVVIVDHGRRRRPGQPGRAHRRRRPAGAAVPGPARDGPRPARRGAAGRLRAAEPHRRAATVVQGRIDPAVLSTITAWCADAGRARRRRPGRAAQPGGRLPGADRTGAALVTDPRPDASPRARSRPRPGARLARARMLRRAGRHRAAAGAAQRRAGAAHAADPDRAAGRAAPWSRSCRCPSRGSPR